MKVAISDGAQIDRVLHLAVEHNLGIEVQEFVSPDNLDRGDSLAREIRDKVAAIPLRGFHGPFFELVPPSRDTRIRQVAWDRFQQAYELAAIVGAQHLVLHTGYIPKTYSRETWIERSVAFWVRLLADKAEGPRLHLENVYDDDYTMVAELVQTVNEELAREALSVCLDIGHVHSNSSRALEDWIIGLGRSIEYVHLHNNDGILDDHWGLWKGKIDVARVLDLLMQHAPDAVWTIEATRAEIEGSILWLKERSYGW